MTHIYAHQPNNVYGIGLVLMRVMVLELWPFEYLTLKINSGSRSRPSSTVMTLIYGHCHSDSYRLGFVSIRRIVNELLPFDHLTLTIWGHSYD